MQSLCVERKSFLPLQQTVSLRYGLNCRPQARYAYSAPPSANHKPTPFEGLAMLHVNLGMLGKFWNALPTPAPDHSIQIQNAVLHDHLCKGYLTHS